MQQLLVHRARAFSTIIPTHVIKRGDAFRSHETFDAARVEAFLKLTGDSNEIHRNKEAAVAAGFQGPIVPGMLCASLFPAIIARHFPGAVYVTQTLQFRRPAPVGSVVKAELVVTQIQGRHVRFDTYCRNAAGSNIIEGIALARLG